MRQKAVASDSNVPVRRLQPTSDDGKDDGDHDPLPVSNHQPMMDVDGDGWLTIHEAAEVVARFREGT